MKPKSLVNICIKIVICYGSAAVNQFVVRLLQNFADVTRVNLIYPPYHHLYYLASLISASAYHGGPEQEPAGRRGGPQQVQRVQNIQVTGSNHKI